MSVTQGSVAVGYLDDGHWSACFGLSYRDLLLYDASSSRRIVRPGGKELRAVTGTGQVHVNRNKVARDFLDNTDAEWLFFIDSDMGFTADTVDRLIKAADPQLRPVVGGLCFACLRRRPDELTFGYGERFLIQPTLYEWVELADEAGFRPMVDYPRDQLVQVAGTGAACLLIHRGALERIRAQHGDAWFELMKHPTAGKGGVARWFSEDLSFCVRLQSCGIPVYVDTGVKTTHEKGSIYLDEEAYDRQQALAVLEEETRGASEQQPVGAADGDR